MLTFLALTLAAAPGADDPHLGAARKTFDNLQFEQTLQHIDQALQQSLPHAELLEAFELQGMSLAILGNWNKAADPFRRILVLDPEHELPSYVAPRFRRFFVETRRRFAPAGWLVARDVTVPHLSADDPPFVVLKLENDPLAMVTGVRVRFRSWGRSQWREQGVPAGPTTKVHLNIDAATQGFDYYWTLLGATASELLFIGSAEEPLRLEFGRTDAPGAALASAAEQEHDPLWKRWWVWTLVGVVAVGAVTTTVLLATQPPTPDCPDHAVCANL